jgi:hypothetical protein
MAKKCGFFTLIEVKFVKFVLPTHSLNRIRSNKANELKIQTQRNFRIKGKVTFYFFGCIMKKNSKGKLLQ